MIQHLAPTTSFLLALSMMFAGACQSEPSRAERSARMAQDPARSTPDDAPRGQQPQGQQPAARDAAAAKTGGDAATAPNAAVAVLLPIGDSQAHGIVTLQRAGKGVRIQGTVRGLTPGQHGFHVHQYGDLRDPKEGKSAGGHFSPHGHPHGRPADEQRHVGDLGNITANEEGVATIDITDEVLALSGQNSVIGRAFVVHEKADQFTQPTGDAGGRVAFGVIGIAEQAGR